MRSIFTPEKHFGDRWVGHGMLNRLGLHNARVRAAATVAGLRRLQSARGSDAVRQALVTQGCVAVPDFLGRDRFERLRDEAHAAVAAVAAADPPARSSTIGFRPAQHRSWGFDRFDGSTLNRFIRLDGLPLSRAAAEDPRLDDLSRVVVGRRLRRGHAYLYLTLNGDEARAHDLQRDFHRDTFFGAMKFWYFIDAVADEDGPMTYVPTSHRLTRTRLAWERRNALAAVARRESGGEGSLSGSFRIGAGDLAAMGLPEPVSFAVPANTLVMANVFGFHRRGDAHAGTRRLALYGNNRPHPFLLAGS